VEPPGTAPGSDPLITSAFMSIVPKDIPNVGSGGARCKRRMPPAGALRQERERDQRLPAISQAAKAASTAKKTKALRKGGASRSSEVARPAAAPA